VFGDKFETKEQLTSALREAGLESCNLLVAFDFTKSNTWQGAKTFGNKCLHALSEQKNMYQPVVYSNAPSAPVQRLNTLSFDAVNTAISKTLMKSLNPYQYVLSVAGTQLEPFDDDGVIPACVFGHARNQIDSYVKELGDNLYKINGVIDAYERAVLTTGLAGPTNFTPVINWALNKVAKNMAYHILLIIGDGVIDDMEETKAALTNACHYPLSIIFVGVGDGSNPKDKEDKWSDMRKLDDDPNGTVDNWQSVYLANIQSELDLSPHPDLDLAVKMLMEVPEQYKYFKKKSMIKN
jgi:E3 ubiquitin-protein ligase RGLG